MRKLIIISFLFAITTTCCGSPNRSVKVREIYYAVNNDTIDRDCIIENRFLTYDKEWKFLSGYALINGRKSSLSSDTTKYYRLPLIVPDSAGVERDSIGLIIRYESHFNHDRSLHFCKYDQWGNITENKSMDVENPSRIVEVLTYEYLYLTDFDYHKKKDGKLEIKKVTTSPWVLRTIRKNGRIVQYTERKIENSK